MLKEACKRSLLANLQAMSKDSMGTYCCQEVVREGIQALPNFDLALLHVFRCQAELLP